MAANGVNRQVDCLAARSPLVKSFAYYGGKMRHLDFILRHLPKPGPEANRFIDVFGGSGVVVLNAGYALRTYNDLNERLVNFFRVLRSRPDELIRLIELTPYSRSEFRLAGEELDANFAGDRLLEESRRFYVHIYQSFNGAPGKGSSWRSIRQTSKKIPTSWANSTVRLGRMVSRLRGMEICCMDGISLVQEADEAGNVLYLDPPYPPETRTSNTDYGKYEMTMAGHERLVEVLRRTRHAKVALSSYASPLYDRLGWERADFETIVPATGSLRTETLYANYRLNGDRLWR